MRLTMRERLKTGLVLCTLLIGGSDRKSVV